MKVVVVHLCNRCQFISVLIPQDGNPGNFAFGFEARYTSIDGAKP